MAKPGWCYFGLSCVSALYIGAVAPYQMCGLHASPVAPTASPVTVSPVVQEVYLRDPLVWFRLCCLCFWRHIQSNLVLTHVMMLPPPVSSCSFMVSGRVFKSLLRFEMISHIV